GICITGNGKALVTLIGGDEQPLIAAGQNRGPLEAYKVNHHFKIIPVAPDDASAIIKLKNGKAGRKEFYYGASFLSQSSRFIQVNDQVSSIEITDTKGNKRNVPVN
ncbi:MAG TPA: hypothetical protein VNR87_00390, partial [Flavisolibacter sp.]|nr:hypothetical protein [Flavisolibacter sp.]